MTTSKAWVPETRFGKWFLRTDMWTHHVVAISLIELKCLFDAERPFSRILDIGCGEGPAFSLLERHFNPQSLIGIDIDQGLVRRAALAASRCRCNAEAHVGDAARLDLPDSSVDMIFCHQTLHHLPNQIEAVRELYRVLKPGGVLLCAESCRSFIESLWVRLLFRHPADVQKSADEYLELLRTTGFKFDQRNISRPYPPWSRPDFGLSQLLGRPVPNDRQAPLIYVAAQKN